MGKGEMYRNEKFVFDKPFRHLPNIYITECTAGDWAFVKVDEKDIRYFVWAVRRSIFPQGDNPYRIRLQWIAVAPRFSMEGSGNGQLVINRAFYGAKGLSAVLTTHLRAKIRNDTLSETSGNHLGGDPKVGDRKMLTVEYTFRGKSMLANIEENLAVKLP